MVSLSAEQMIWSEGLQVVWVTGHLGDGSTIDYCLHLTQEHLKTFFIKRLLFYNGVENFSDSPYLPYPDPSVVGCSWEVENPLYTFCKQCGLNPVILQTLYGLSKLPFCTNEICSIVRPDCLYLTPSNNKSPQCMNA